MDRGVPQWIGVDMNGLREWSGLKWIGTDWVGVDWCGLEWLAVDWNGFEWMGVDWGRLARLEWLGVAGNGW